MKKKLVDVIGKAEHTKLINSLTMLHERWQDEKEYEDWKEYEIFGQKLILNVGGKINKFSKRPFKIVFTIQESKYFIKINNYEVVWGSIN